MRYQPLLIPASRLIVVLCAYLYISGVAVAQCSYTAETAIVDASVTDLQLQVTGATGPDLSSRMQCVASVDIVFRHQFVGDLWIDLISPAGQAVRLVGQALPSSPSTSFVNWQVTFLPCSDPVAPDIGLPDTWSNLAPWAAFTTYTGSYYPYQGCLEDFDIGSINGFWTIRAEDISLFGAGSIASFTITFCDGAGINCGICDIAIPTISTDTSTYCVGRAGGVPGINPVYPVDYTLDATVNTYGYAVFEQDQLIAYTDTPMSESYGVGEYQFCPLTYETAVAAALPPAGVLLSPQQLSIDIAELNICAEASPLCHTLRIVDVPDTLRADLFACQGERISYNGVEYMTDQVIYDTRAGAFCDTVIELGLEFIKDSLELTPIAPLITCSREQIWLSAGLGQTASASYAWSTVGGNVLQRRADSILVNAGGIYAVTMTDRGCMAAAQLFVAEDATRPVIDIDLDSFDCVVDTILLIALSVDTVTTRWQRPDQTLSVADTLVALDPGLYTVTATAANGCETVQSFDLLVDTLIQTPQFTIAPITCSSPTTMPRVTSFDPSYSYEWTGPGFFADVISPVTMTSGGSYELTYTAPNGCQGSVGVNIDDQRDQPILGLSLPTVDCSEGPFVAELTADLALSNVGWLDLSTGTVYAGTRVEVDDGGRYRVSYATPSGCIQDTLVDIPYDTIRPFVIATGGLVDCFTDSIQLGIVGDTSGLSIEWRGPGTFSSGLVAPFVDIPGDYTLEVSTNNACIYSTTATVDRSTDKPQVTFTVIPITCNQDTATISVSDKTYSYRWSENILPLDGDSFRLAEPADVSVTVTNTITGCDDIYGFEITDRRRGATVSITGPELTCLVDSARLEVIIEDSISSFSWQGVDPFYVDSLQPFVFAGGDVILTTIDEYGCASIDTFAPAVSRDGPVVTFADTILTCSQTRVALDPISDVPLDSVAWRGPSFASSAIVADVSLGGTYTFTAYSANGCVSIIEQEVVYDTITPSYAITAPAVLICTDQMTEATVSGPRIASILWRDPSAAVVSTMADVDIDQPGRYTVELVGDNGCPASGRVDVVSEIVYPTISFEVDQLDCDSDTATIVAVSPIAGHTYRWLDAGRLLADSILVVEDVGPYAVEVTNLEGCRDTFSAAVVLDTIAPNTTLLLEDTISCSAATVYVTVVDPSYEVVWKGANGLFLEQDSLLVGDAGTYRAVITSLNGCIDSAEIFVPIDTSVLLLDLFADTITCNAGKVPLTVTANATIVSANWTGPFAYAQSGTTTTVFSEGVYTVVVEGDNGCTITDSIEVIRDVSTPIFDIVEVFLPCDSSGTMLSIDTQDSIFAYRWLGPGDVFSDAATPLVFDPGVYIASVAGASGCFGSDTFSLEYDTDLPLFGLEVDTFYCDQTTVDMVATDVSDDLSVRWLGPGGYDRSMAVVSTVDTGLYQLIVTGLNRCKDTIVFRPIDDRVVPVVDLEQLDSLVCEQMEARLLASVSDSLPGALLSGVWSDETGAIVAAQTGVTVSLPGVYTYTAVNARNRCQAIRSISVDQLPVPDIQYGISATDASCEGFKDASIVIDSLSGGYAPYTFSIDDSGFSSNRQYFFLDGGRYTITSRDRYGCVDTIMVTVAPGADPVAILPADTSMRLGDTLVIDALIEQGNVAIDEISWLGSDVELCDTCVQQVLAPLATTWIQLSVVDANGCETSDEMVIEVNRIDDIVLSNIFRPLGNMDNQVFFFPDVTGVQRVQSFRVYDRLGNLVHTASDFEPGDQTYGWDGIFNRDYAMSGVYTYYISVIYVDGHVGVLVGDVTLLR